jgi:hypothetical protein
LGAYARGAIGAFGGWQVFDDEESNALDRSQEGKEIEAVLKTYFGAKINQLQQQVQAKTNPHPYPHPHARTHHQHP